MKLFYSALAPLLVGAGLGTRSVHKTDNTYTKPALTYAGEARAGFGAESIVITVKISLNPPLQRFWSGEPLPTLKTLGLSFQILEKA